MLVLPHGCDSETREGGTAKEIYPASEAAPASLNVGIMRAAHVLQNATLHA
jgi:hypothetical protein